MAGVVAGCEEAGTAGSAAGEADAGGARGWEGRRGDTAATAHRLPGKGRTSHYGTTWLVRHHPLLILRALNPAHHGRCQTPFPATPRLGHETRM
jgi:hypothetical protein